MVTPSNLLQNYSFILNVHLVLSFSETSVCSDVFSEIDGIERDE